jgi:hypothetical protein
VNTHQYLVAAREGIDDVFGAGLAAKNPSIVGACIQTCRRRFRRQLYSNSNGRDRCSNRKQGFTRLVDDRLAQLPEAVPELLGKKLGLLECREMTALIEFAPIDQLRIVLLCPATRSAPDLVREDTDSYRNIDNASGRISGRPVLPIDSGRGGCGVRQPVKRDVVEHLC